MFGRKKRAALRRAVVEDIKKLRHEETEAVKRTENATKQLHKNIKRNGFHVEMLVAVGGQRRRAGRA